MKILKDCLFIAHPSVRSLAYIQSLNELLLTPEYVVWLAPEKENVNAEVAKHWQTYNYERFFNLNITIDGLLPENNYSVAGSSINSPELNDLLTEIKPKIVIFTGGGIVSVETFGTCAARWVHFHPGSLPDFRGSTCFYYSYLNEKRLACTGFEMTPVLDHGEVLLECQYSLNYPLKRQEVFFIDYVLDPQLRRLAFKTWLRHQIDNAYNDDAIVQVADDLFLAGSQSKPSGSNDWPYYVIHPELRALCARQIASDYREEQPVGIFLTSGE